MLLSERLRVKAGAYPSTCVGAMGAGDAFDAGYIAGLLAGGDPLRHLEWGSELGASCVRSIGAMHSRLRGRAQLFDLSGLSARVYMLASFILSGSNAG